MKYLSSIFFSFLAINIVQAETFMGKTELSNQILDNIVIFGPAHLTEIQAKSLTVTGPLTFDRLYIKNNVTVLGPIKEGSTDLACKDLDVIGTINAKNIECEDVHIMGCAHIDGIEATGKVRIVGTAEIKKAKLEDLSLTAREMRLTDVKAKDIIVKRLSLIGQTQTLELMGSTIISGSINFKSDKGTVVLEYPAKVNGEINGAILKQRLKAKEEESAKTQEGEKQSTSDQTTTEQSSTEQSATEPNATEQNKEKESTAEQSNSVEPNDNKENRENEEVISSAPVLDSTAVIV